MQTEEKKVATRTFRLSIVVPMYNEEKVCPLFFQRILPIVEKVTNDFEIVCVDDGSTDRTLDLLKSEHAREPRIKIIRFTRNFGKESALTAGIDHATGDAVIPIDVDLQDPPELIPELVDKWLEGNEIVAAVRSDRKSDSMIKRLTAHLFYRVAGYLDDIPIRANSGDFRLMDRAVVEALKTLPERTRFMKGLFAWVGFKQAEVYYVRTPRAAGKTKWKLWKLWNFALEGIFSFTTLPLRVWTYLGFCVALVAFTYMCFIIIRTLVLGIDVPGYASLIVIILFFSGLQMIGLGVLGEYLGRVMIETKRRPLYLIHDMLGFDAQKSGGAPARGNRNTADR